MERAEIEARPFTNEEWEKILRAIEVYPNRGRYGSNSGGRIWAFVMLLRHTGLRIRDVIQLRWLQDIQSVGSEWRVFLYTGETGEPVYVPFARDVAEEIEWIWMHLDRSLALMRGEGYEHMPDYIFWSGHGDVKSAVRNWQRTLRTLGAIAGIPMRAHRFRDTFALSLLEAGVPIETVAILLGHVSTKVREKYYAAWLKSCRPDSQRGGRVA